MAIPKTKMTEEEFLRLKDNGRKYELVDGETKSMLATCCPDFIVVWPTCLPLKRS